MQHINKYISTVIIITDVLSLVLYVDKNLKNECYIVATRQAYKNFGTISISTKTMHCKHIQLYFHAASYASFYSEKQHVSYSAKLFWVVKYYIV